MAKPELSFAILSLLESLHAQGHEAVSPGQIKKQLGESRATINRHPPAPCGASRGGLWRRPGPQQNAVRKVSFVVSGAIKPGAEPAAG